MRLLEQGASLYDVAKLLGINVSTAELYYSPYCRELQDRGARLVRGMRSPEVVTGETASKANLVTFCAPLSPALGHFGEQQANEDEPVAKAKP